MKQTTKRKRSRAGRQTGGRNRGWWFRKGRGWYTTEGRQSVALLAENGEHLKDQDAEGEAERAYAVSRATVSALERLAYYALASFDGLTSP